MKALIWIVIILLFLGAAGSFAAMKWSQMMAAAKIPTFKIAQVSRANVVATISATGTLQPEESIDVGAQVAGRIVEFGKDSNGQIINNNSEVKTGALLAKIDDTTHAADVAQAKAQLDQDDAAIQKAQADILFAQAKLNAATRDWERAKLLDADVLAREVRDNYQANFETAGATLKSQEAVLNQSKAARERDQANLDRAKRNVDYCTIVAPVDGVIIDRRVNIGQTVVSSLNSPSLFLLARDLTHMWINVAVNEADIGLVAEDQPVTFTVDARPEETFHGTVRKKRLFGQNTQNVITYVVEITAENPQRKLIPYQTANCKFEVGRRENLLTVPNSALTWVPPTEHIAADVRDQAEQLIKTVDEAKPGHSGPKHRTATTHPATTPATEPAPLPDRLHPGILWTRDGDFVRPIAIMTGISDGAFTLVESDKIKEGMDIVTGEEPKSAWGAAPKK